MILVTGATGRVGGGVAAALRGRTERVRLLVRDPARAPQGGTPVVADLDDPGSLDKAFDGVEKVFLMVPGIGMDHTRGALAAAARAGVRHIVLLSSYHVCYDPLPRMAAWHAEREAMLRDSGIPWTVLRPGGFMTNALDWIPSLRTRGYVLDPAGPGRIAPIDPLDIGAVGAAVLTEAGHENRVYTLTGAESLTIAEQVAIMSGVLGRDLPVREVTTPEEVVAARFPNGAPAPLAEAITEAFGLARADTIGQRTDTVQTLLGRAPTAFRTWCERNAHLFAGLPQA